MWDIEMLRALRCLIALVALGASNLTVAAEYDVVVYGGTAGGVIAAVQARAMGKSVVLIEPGEHLGGLTSGGLGATDIGNKDAIGGLARHFYHRVWKHYQDSRAWRQETSAEYAKKRRAPSPDTMWTFEPHVAEKIIDELVADYKIPVVWRKRLDLTSGVKKDGTRIMSITMEGGDTFSGRMFIDATYEGDLMPKAGVSYHVGREANKTYDETLNGVQAKNAVKHQFMRKVDPYISPGDPSSGLLPGVHGDSPGEEWTGDRRVQAYNFRICMTDARENSIPFPKPAGYDPLRYELLLRYMQAGVFDLFGNNQLMPNRKTDTNNHGGFSSDNIGMNYEYPEGDYETRERIFNEHVTYHQGMLYFLVNDPRVPAKAREATARWGLAKDEFKKTGGWPHQLYIREARRMISDYVMTEHNCRWTKVAEDSVGLGAYNMDSHNVQRYVQDGAARNEGDIQVAVAAPYAISYRSIVPKASECTNLFVPVCLSASHIAYGSIRMEPVFMVLGQSAATAACMAIDGDIAVQQVPYDKLKERLLADGQVLEWKRRPRAANTAPARN